MKMGDLSAIAAADMLTKDGRSFVLYSRAVDDPEEMLDERMALDRLTRNKALSPQRIVETLKDALIAQQEDASAAVVYRARAAWRITREIAVVVGLLQDGDSIADLTEEDWNGTHTPRALKGSGVRHRRRSVWDRGGGSDYRPTASFLVQGITLLPPDLPEGAEDDPEFDPDDPQKDPEIYTWLEFVWDIVRNFSIDRGTPGSALNEFDPPILPDPAAGKYGCAMLVPRLVRSCYPGQDEIVMFEDMMVREMMPMLVKHGELGARRYIYAKFGLSTAEATGLIRLCKASARRNSYEGVEESRVMMVLALRDAISRAQNALDGSLELRLLKQLAIVQGLNKTIRDDSLAAMLRDVKRLSADETSAEQLALEIRGEERDGIILPPATPCEVR